MLEARAAIAELGVRAGVDRRAVVGVDDVAGGAAAGAIVAGVIVGAEEVERRIEQARFLQADEDGIGAVLGAEAAVAQAGARLAGIFQRSGNADLGAEAAAALEDAQDVARLADLEARQRIEERHDALRAHLFFASAAARSAAAAARRSCCSFRRSAACLSGTEPLL